MMSPNIENKGLYTHKLADELLRYSRIRNFILGPDSSIPFQIVPLVLKNTEEIFESEAEVIKASSLHEYVKIGEEFNTTFDTVYKE